MAREIGPPDTKEGRNLFFCVLRILWPETKTRKRILPFFFTAAAALSLARSLALSAISGNEVGFLLSAAAKEKGNFGFLSVPFGLQAGHEKSVIRS